MDRRRASPDRARDLRHDRHSGAQAAVSSATAGSNISGTTIAAALLKLTAQPAYQTAPQLVGTLPAAVQSSDPHLGSPFSPKPYPAPVLPSTSARGPLSPSSRLGSASGALPPLPQGWGSPVRGPADAGGNPFQPQGWGSPVRGASAVGGTPTSGGALALPHGWASPPSAAHSREPALPGWPPGHAGGWLSPPALLSPPAGGLHPALLVRAGLLSWFLNQLQQVTCQGMAILSLQRCDSLEVLAQGRGGSSPPSPVRRSLSQGALPPFAAPLLRADGPWSLAEPGTGRAGPAEGTDRRELDTNRVINPGQGLARARPAGSQSAGSAAAPDDGDNIKARALQPGRDPG